MVLHVSLGNFFETLQNNCLEKIQGIRWDDFKTNDEVKETAQQPNLFNVIRQNRWKYHGYVLRMGRERLPKAVLFWRPMRQKRRR